MRLHPAHWLELAFDRGVLDSVDESLWPEGLALVRAFVAKDWKAVYLRAQKIVAQPVDPVAKAFAIQWGVSAAETEFDLARREQMLALWAHIPDWIEDPYCRYLHAYQNALTRFFAGSLRDAGICFRQAYDAALEFEYERGQMRCLFHLGLVERDRGNFPLALELYQSSQALATARGAGRYAKHIAAHQAEAENPGAGSGDSFVAGKARLENLLVEKKFSEAKVLLLELERKRRELRLGRKRESLGLYLGLFHLATGRSRQGNRILGKISDPVLKLQALQLKGKIWNLSAAEAKEILYLQESLGVAQIVFYGKAAEHTEIGGVRLDSIKQESVRELLLFLLRNPGPQSKEVIARHLWRVEYDPTVHDKKVYKLILQTKKALGIQDLFLNSYGAYELQPRLLGKATKVS